MSTAQALREKANYHRKAAEELDAAANTVEKYGVDAEPSPAPHTPQQKVAVTARDRTRAQAGAKEGFSVTDGVRKNQDFCYQALKAAGNPMKVDDLVKAIQALGSPVGNPSTVTIYLRHDEKKRFVRPEPGVWALASGPMQDKMF